MNIVIYLSTIVCHKSTCKEKAPPINFESPFHPKNAVVRLTPLTPLVDALAERQSGWLERLHRVSTHCPGPQGHGWDVRNSKDSCGWQTHSLSGGLGHHDLERSHRYRSLATVLWQFTHIIIFLIFPRWLNFKPQTTHDTDILNAFWCSLNKCTSKHGRFPKEKG